MMSRSPAALAFALALLAAGSAVARPKVQPPPAPSATATSDDHEAIRSLRESIGARELFAALALRPEQRAALIPLVEEAVSWKSERQKERRAAAPELRALLERYDSELRRDGQPGAATLQALDEFGDRRRPDADERKGRREARRDLREDLREILDEQQRTVLATFRPLAALGPDDEELDELRAEAQSDRGGRRGQAGAQEGGDAQRARRHAVRNVRAFLLSEPMLALLKG